MKSITMKRLTAAVIAASISISGCLPAIGPFGTESHAATVSASFSGNANKTIVAPQPVKAHSIEFITQESSYSNQVFTMAKDIVLAYRMNGKLTIKTYAPAGGKTLLEGVEGVTSVFQDSVGHVYAVLFKAGQIIKLDHKTLVMTTTTFEKTGLPEQATLLSLQRYQNQWIALIDKKGMFQSDDQGKTWKAILEKLPLSSNQKDYDFISLYVLNDKLYSLSRKAGVVQWLPEQKEWALLPNSAAFLEEARSLMNLSYFQGQLFLGTKTGLYKLDPAGQGKWVPVKGMGDEVELQVVQGTDYFLYAHEEKQLYKMDRQGIMRPYGLKIDRIKHGKIQGIAVKDQQVLLGLEDGYGKVPYRNVEVSAKSVAESLTQLQQPVANAGKLYLPQVPYGFKVSIHSTDQPKVINAKGEIAAPQKETLVKVILKVTQEGVKDIALSKPLLVKVPKTTAKGPFDGIYQGSAKGFGDQIAVKVEIKGNHLVDLQVVDHRETDAMATVKEALIQIPRQIISKQDIDVDSITSATVTSRAIMNATNQAVKGTPFEKKQSLTHVDYELPEQEGQFVYAVNGIQLFGSTHKTTKKSTLYVLNSNQELTPILKDLTAIDVAASTPDQKIVSIIGQKEGSILLNSLDGGKTWQAPIAPKGIGKEKVESYLMISEKEAYVTVNKFGLYKTVDGGLNWILQNGNLTRVPERPEELDIRKIYQLEGQFYALTKKNGLLVSPDAKQWTPVSTSALSASAKEVWDLTLVNQTLYLLTKAGLFQKPVKGDGPWQAVKGFVGEGRVFLKKGNTVYAVNKTYDIFALKSNEAKVAVAKPFVLTGADPRAVMVTDTHFYTSHRNGLTRVSLESLLQ